MFIPRDIINIVFNTRSCMFVNKYLYKHLFQSLEYFDVRDDTIYYKRKKSAMKRLNYRTFFNRVENDYVFQKIDKGDLIHIVRVLFGLYQKVRIGIKVFDKDTKVLLKDNKLRYVIFDCYLYIKPIRPI